MSTRDFLCPEDDASTHLVKTEYQKIFGRAIKK